MQVHGDRIIVEYPRCKSSQRGGGLFAAAAQVPEENGGDFHSPDGSKIVPFGLTLDIPGYVVVR